MIPDIAGYSMRGTPRRKRCDPVLLTGAWFVFGVTVGILAAWIVVSL